MPREPESLLDAQPNAVPDGAEEVLLAPAAYVQRRLWFLAQLEPNSPAYNILITLRLKGSVDHAALERALNKIVQRHEVLRTTFALRNDEVMQVISPNLHVPLTLVDKRLLGPEEREPGWRRVAADEGARPFDLQRGPLFRSVLVMLGANDHVLLITVHHIVFDGWSEDVFVRELAEFYTSEVEGRQATLPPLPIQYADFAAFEQEQLTGPGLDALLQHWTRALAGAPTTLNLPTDHVRPPVQTARGGLESTTLAGSLWQQVAAFSRREGVTVFMTLLAAFGAVLHRLSGQTDLLIGIPAAGRDRRELEGLIGFFINTLVLRVDASGDPTFRALVGRVRGNCLAAYAHRDLPFDRLVEALNPERTRDRHPIFQVMFALDPKAHKVAFAGIELERIVVHNGSTKCDLLFEIAEDTEHVTLMAEYSVDLFEPATVAALLQRCQRVLEAAVTDPDVPIGEIDLMDAAERETVVIRWNATAVAYPPDALLHTMIEAQVARTPDAVAIEYEGQTLTHREIDRRANQLAHRLRALGVGPEVLVGLCLERSPHLIVALCATLKAGGAYVPLDPEYPADRLAFMLSDADAPVLITTRALAERLPAAAPSTVLIDEEWDRLERFSATKPDELVQPDGLAYMIYTSGSTGRPKGALNTHRGICNRLAWMRDQYDVGGTTTILQKTPISFDVSVWELFLPLITGARMVLAKPGGHRDPAYLIDLITTRSVTMTHFVPSMLRVFLGQSDVERCHSLEHVICSGEGLPAELRGAFFQRLSCGLHNLYGPTEAAVDVTFWDCRQESQTPTVPIGRPVANTQIYILDEERRAVPIGIPGELYIGGVQVGRGYHRRADLTAERFIANPFSADPESRLYKTGDLCRFLPHGAIDYLGRLDHQVKVRGFRIELGEIEATLAAHPAVREVVVIAREDVPGDKRLIAYVVVRAEPAATASALREYVSRKLPDYMVPSHIVQLDAMPLSPNGKVDRAALPAVTPAVTAEPRDFANEVESELARIWCHLLRVPSVGPDDNFFELGGHSLLAITLFSRIYDRFGRSLPIGSLFEHPTIRGLAALLPSERSEDAAASTVVTLQAGGDRPPFFFMHGVDGSVWEIVRLAQSLGAGRPVYGLQMPKFDEQAPLSVERLAAGFVEEIRRNTPAGPYHLGGFCAAAKTAFEVARQLRAAGQQVGLVAVFEYTLDADRPPASVLPTVAGFFRNLPYWVVDDMIPIGPKRLAGRVRSRLRIGWLKAKRRLGLVPASAQPDIRDVLGMWVYPSHHAKVLARLYDAFERYAPESYLGRVTIFRARTDRLFGRGRLRDLGWGRVAAGGVDVIDVPGSHETMLDAFVQKVARRLVEALDRADAEVPSDPPG